jgi:hypothetical protein
MTLHEPCKPSEPPLGKGEVESSILSHSTIPSDKIKGLKYFPIKLMHSLHGEEIARIPGG